MFGLVLLFFIFIFSYSTLKCEERRSARSDGGDLVRFTAFQQAERFPQHYCGGLILRLQTPKAAHFTPRKAQFPTRRAHARASEMDTRTQPPVSGEKRAERTITRPPISPLLEAKKGKEMSARGCQIVCG